MISALCEAGADADARKSTGGTPLHTAADCDQPRAVASLLALTLTLTLTLTVTLTLTLTLTLALTRTLTLTLALTRWMFTTHEALCYRHVGPGSQAPRGKTTSIAFRTVQRVGVHTDEPTVLFLDCATRQYFFRFPSATLCETCAGRIAVAAAQAGDAPVSYTHLTLPTILRV